uniref:Uncharacterized protein n=1 Tax=Anguilla anguilla TaxID=7936 RepID=A0A0E9W565_ANGAN
MHTEQINKNNINKNQWRNLICRSKCILRPLSQYDQRCQTRMHIVLESQRGNLGHVNLSQRSYYRLISFSCWKIF